MSCGTNKCLECETVSGKMTHQIPEYLQKLDNGNLQREIVGSHQDVGFSAANGDIQTVGSARAVTSLFTTIPVIIKINMVTVENCESAVSQFPHHTIGGSGALCGA